MNGTSKYTVWHYVGCGCVALFVLALLGIGGCFFLLRDWGHQVERELKDPEARAAKARSLLGYEELPAGYHPGISFSMPFVMEVVMLGDRELPAGEDMERMRDDRDLFEERGFIYFKMRSFGQAQEEFRQDMSFQFDAEETLAEGEVEAGGASVEYRAQRGTARTTRGSRASIAAELEIECGDSFTRRAVWFTPARAAEPVGEVAPETGVEAEVEDLTGTPADEAALRTFLDHFHFCG